MAERSVVPAPGSPDADSLLGSDVDVRVTGELADGLDTAGEPAPAPGAGLAAGVSVAQDVTTTSAKTETVTQARDDGVVMLRIPPLA